MYTIQIRKEKKIMRKANEKIKPSRSPQMERIYDRIYRSKENAEHQHDMRFVRILIIFLILLFALCTFLCVQVYYTFIFLITPGVLISPYLCAFINDKTDRKYKPNEDRSVKRSKKLKETQNGHLPYKK